MNKSERPFQNTPSASHSATFRLSQKHGQATAAAVGERHRTAGTAHGPRHAWCPRGSEATPEPFPRPGRRYTALGQGNPPLHSPSRIQLSGWGVFLRLRSEMPPGLSGEGAARLPPGALRAPPTGPPCGSSPRSADKGRSVGRTYLPALPAEKIPNLN